MFLKIDTASKKTYEEDELCKIFKKSNNIQACKWNAIDVLSGIYIYIYVYTYIHSLSNVFTSQLKAITGLNAFYIDNE